MKPSKLLAIVPILLVVGCDSFHSFSVPPGGNEVIDKEGISITARSGQWRGSQWVDLQVLNKSGAAVTLSSMNIITEYSEEVRKQWAPGELDFHTNESRIYNNKNKFDWTLADKGIDQNY